MHVAVVINPVSGRRARRSTPEAKRQLAERVLSDLGVAADVRMTEGRHDATRLARDAVDHGADIVCAWGGDGTLNEVASALAFGAVPLAIVPSGSGNGLARELGAPADPVAALTVAVRGHDRRLDAGDVNRRLFFNVAGLGLDALIAHRFASHPRRGFGPYLAIATRELCLYKPVTYDLVVDGRPVRERALMIVAANSRQYGNGAIIAPGARPDDGELDLVVVRHGSLAGTISRVPRLFRGTLDRCAAVTTQRVKLVNIDAGPTTMIHLDGEPVLLDGPLAIAVRPGAILVRCAPIDA
jgi:diacylglycerol kinase (ATP)